ncbi:subtilisin family serine protease [Actinoplanes lutulentus]|uniref:Peptidase inhibitor I9 n=1 Tax=Actinoplanes lutulentus TaxID=1287878 RepID=A0A327ZE24_9ACTN|nr:S8 family peptidase [Actinoplanes lutulentus]MBB2945885.1 subtilisin family serine protease [Actinoplanes lutulentus]RAK37934.1 peptidase inhibitor I9 [Actinoplanes lutulentus]
MFGTDARFQAVRLIAAASAASVTFFGLAAPASAAPAAAELGVITGAGVEGAVPGSYIVVLKPGSAAAGRVPSASQELVREYGGTVGANYLSTVRGFQLHATAFQAARLAADESVQYVEQDATISSTAVPSAQAEQVTWGLDRIDQRTAKLSKSYRYTSAAGVTAYVIDTGVRVSHQEFGGRASNGWDFVDNDKTANDCNGHGTHVAGTIGGATYGVAKDIDLVALKVLGCDGSGKFSDFIAAVDWVTANAKLPAVANMSLGGPVSKTLDAAVNRSIAKGVTYAIAGGNENKNACKSSPGGTPDAITVGAVDKFDKRASFSNYGTCLDLFAPGVDIQSAGKGSNSAVKTMSGTSMASPHVAGAAALVLAEHPAWTPRQVRDDLVANAGSGLVRSPGSGSPNKLLYTGHLAS